MQRTNLILLSIGLGIAVFAAALVAAKKKQGAKVLKDERLDAELDDSFPASDPPSHSSPSGAQVG